MYENGVFCKREANLFFIFLFVFGGTLNLKPGYYSSVRRVNFGPIRQSLCGERCYFFL